MAAGPGAEGNQPFRRAWDGSVLVAVSATESMVEDIQRNQYESELMRTWKFGCPPDPRQVLLAQGRGPLHAPGCAY